MRCKVNFVPTVRIIMPRRLRQSLDPSAFILRKSPEYIAFGAPKELDIGRGWSIIIITAVVRNHRGLADARRPGSTIQTRCPQAQWDPQSPSGRHHRSP